MTESPEDGFDPPCRATCVAHRLSYDPSVHGGCVLCARPEPNERPPRTRLSKVLGLATALCLSAALLFPWLTHSGSEEVAPVGAQHGPAHAEHEHEATATVAPSASRAPLQVLFVGSALTAANDLPGMVRSLAEAAGEERRFSPRALTFNGFTLSDHLATNSLQSLLSSTAWDAVVLQEQAERAGCSPRDREILSFAPLRALDAMIRKAGSKTVLYVPFVDKRAPDSMQQRVNEGQRQIATELKAELVPVASVWERALHQRPDLGLWSLDRIRLLEAGSYLAACAFYAHFYRRSPVGNSYIAHVYAPDALAIQSAAAAEVLGSPLPSGEARAEPPPPLSAGDSDPEHSVETSAGAASTVTDVADRLRHESIEAELQERALRTARSRVSIVLYTRTSCEDCENAVSYLRWAQLEFQERNVDQDAQAMAAARSLFPRATGPIFNLDGRTFVGWDQRRFESALEFAIRKRARDDAAPPSNTLVLEGESLLPAVDSAAPVTAQPNCCGLSWSGRAQLFMQAMKSGDDLWLDLDIPESGSYELSAVLTQARDYGIVEFRLEGATLGTFDGYVADTVRTKPVGFGIVRLASGHHPLILAVTGKDPASSGYFVGLDVMRLRRLTR